MAFFFPPEECNEFQLLFLTVIYAVILYQASGLLAGGSELLQLFPSVAGIVGSVVLPILGAVPDGMMVLFSGIGPKAQTQVSVGVGALAGSTVMLLTFPWFIALVSGRVPLVNGEPKYGQVTEDVDTSFMNSGVTYQDSLQKAAKIMLGTTLLFLVIQIPATIQEFTTSSTREQAAAESTTALVGLILCVAAFVGYLAYCVKDANEDKQLEKVVAGIKARKISIGAALRFAKDTTEGAGSSKEAMCKKSKDRLAKIVWPFFQLYDADNSRSLDVLEFKNLMYELGEKAKEGIEKELQKRDTNANGKVEFDELMDFLMEYLQESRLSKVPNRGCTRYMPAYDEQEEEEEMPEDLVDLSPDQQMRRLMFRSTWMMGLGTALVLVFSDPMVDILSDWGRRLNVSAFYISFILAPFASNASELLSAYTYAMKKSSKSITTSLSTLVGAACMNNTFCLAIFLALIYVQELAWQFTAETFAIVLIQWVIGLMILKSRSMTMCSAYIILACYPGCLFIVWFCQKVLMWD